ncbi:unnamed protein product [Rodentolepis nana]|uniref:YTH domain-containing protein n=1 Tax=Rodentolepis nana TaxID=102285 RepID=A0A0R3TVU6_RODNA|nr:unnamed protein product [Rodentolepis nana]
MAPTLKTEAQCLETPLNKKTLKDVAEKVEPETGNSPFYNVVVKNAAVRLKSAEKGGKKLKSFKFKKVDEMHVDERGNMVTLGVERKKNKMVCLAMKFGVIDEREKFQDLAKWSNPLIRFSTRNYALNDVKEDKSELKMEQATSSGYETAPNRNQNRARSQHPPFSLRQSGEPPRFPSRYSSSSKGDYYLTDGSQGLSSRYRTNSIGSPYHQVNKNRFKSNDMESLPPSEFSAYSMRSPNVVSTSVSYAGPNGSTARIYRPRSQKAPRSSRKKNLLDIRSDDSDESAFINSTIRERRGGGRKKELVPIDYAVPKESRNFHRLNRQPLTAGSRKRKSRSHDRSHRNDSPVTCPVIYLLWDSSGEEEEESDYEYAESPSNYRDSLYSSASECSGKLENAEMLLRELHRQRNVRHR